jgi:hypothetical protein
MKPRQPAKVVRCQCLIDGMQPSGDPLDARERFEERNRDAPVYKRYLLSM